MLPQEIAAGVQKWQYNDRIELAESPHEALKRALFIAGLDDMICVTGSLYLVGEIKRIFSHIT
jgi:dihydrofolate synthase/folylpolyglutamate synthase